jgi:predicted permease
MRQLRSFSRRLLGMFGNDRSEREFVAEMESHLQMHIEDSLRTGMSREEARRNALIKLGGLQQTKENYHDRKGLPVLEVFFQDSRYGVRMLLKNSGFTAVAVLTLALGIAANVTIFSFVSAVLLKKPALDDVDRVMSVYATNSANGRGRPNLYPVSAPIFFQWKRQNEVFSDMAAADAYESASLTGDGEPERANAIFVTANYFSVLGVPAEFGRTFVAGEDTNGHEHEVILSHKLWQRRYGSDKHLLGKQIRLNAESFLVVGVMPARFNLAIFPADLWTPLVLHPAEESSTVRQTRNLYPVARLKPGVSEEQARANLTAIGNRMEAIYPDTEKGWGAGVLTLHQYQIQEFNANIAITMLLTAVGFVLLIACANIAGLLLARATGRGKEMAIRVAVGAGRIRVMRQLLTEALLIAVLGGAAGLALTLVTGQMLRSALAYNDEVSALDMSLDWRVLAYTAGLSLMAAILFGLAPALHTGTRDIFSVLKSESASASPGRVRSRLRSVLVAGEVALAVILLTGAGLLIKGVVQELHQSLGFTTENLLTAQIELPASQYGQATKKLLFYENLLSKLNSIPTADSAALVSSLPATGTGDIAFRLKGQERVPASERTRARYYVTSPGYMKTAEIPIISGRDFSEADGPNAPPVAIVSTAFARRFFPKGDALGQQVLIDSGDAGASQWRAIVAVVGNVKIWPMQSSEDPEIYEPSWQRPGTAMALMVRTKGNPSQLTPALRSAVWAIDKELPVTRVITMPELVSKLTSGDRLFGKLLGTFACLAMVLSGVGLYGLVAYSVGQRKQEIGIRVALGAGREGIMRLVLRDGMKLALLGALLGLAAALPLPRAFESMLQDFHFHSAWIFVIVTSMMIFVALLACYIPARRAARVDPIVALRYE